MCNYYWMETSISWHIFHSLLPTVYSIISHPNLCETWLSDVIHVLSWLQGQTFGIKAGPDLNRASCKIQPYSRHKWTPTRPLGFLWWLFRLFTRTCAADMEIANRCLMNGSMPSMKGYQIHNGFSRSEKIHYYLVGVELTRFRQTETPHWLHVI